MKATKILLAAAAFAATALTTNAQSLFIKQTDGTVHEYAVETIKEVEFGESTENLGKISITYKANDGTEASATQQGIEGKVFTIGKDVSFTAPTNKELIGWNTSADGSGVQCANGEMISLKRNITFYAQWAEYVDLGLSVKWATCNVGATKPEEYGYYFAWGETQPKVDYSWSTYRFTTDEGNTFTKYNSTDGKKTLDPEDDAATANWGDNWRMPTKAEIEELLDTEKCEWTWKSEEDIDNQYGVSGYEVKSKANGNSIFLSAGGNRIEANLNLVGSMGVYWTASLSEYGLNIASRQYFFSDDVSLGVDSRYCGYPIRPVLKTE